MSNLQADGLHSQLSELGGTADTFGTTELVYFSSYSNYQDWHTENWFTKMNTPSTHSCVAGHRYQTFCVKGTVQKHVGSLAFNGHSSDNMTQTGRTDAPTLLSVCHQNELFLPFLYYRTREWMKSNFSYCTVCLCTSPVNNLYTGFTDCKPPQSKELWKNIYKRRAL